MPCSGTAEREAALRMAERIDGEQRVTVGTHRRSFRLAKDGGDAAQNAPPRGFQSWLGVHLRGSGLQSGADEEPAAGDGSNRISLGRSVSGRRKSGHLGTQSPTKPLIISFREDGKPSASIFFSSLLREQRSRRIESSGGGSLPCYLPFRPHLGRGAFVLFTSQKTQLSRFRPR